MHNHQWLFQSWKLQSGNLTNKWFSAYISLCRSLWLDWLSSFSSNKQSFTKPHQKYQKNGGEESWSHKSRRLWHYSSTKVPRERQRWVCPYMLWSLIARSMPALQMHRQIHQQSSHDSAGEAAGLLNEQGFVVFSPKAAHPQSAAHTAPACWSHLPLAWDWFLHSSVWCGQAQSHLEWMVAKSRWELFVTRPKSAVGLLLELSSFSGFSFSEKNFLVLPDLKKGCFVLFFSL